MMNSGSNTHNATDALSVIGTIAASSTESDGQQVPFGLSTSTKAERKRKKNDRQNRKKARRR